MHLCFFPGTYDIGLNETLTEKLACTNSPSKQPGDCVLLFDCPQVFSELTDKAAYEKFFCEVER